MSSNKTQTQHTQHAFLVAWGSFAEHIGLPQKLQAVPLKQKRYTHTPQAKVLEFLVAILGGLEHLQDISLAAHPLDKDQAVAEAWGQPGWADYSGVSRTLSRPSWDETHQLVQVLEQVSQPFIQNELTLLRSQGKRLRLDGDLTGIPVSNTQLDVPACRLWTHEYRNPAGIPSSLGQSGKPNLWTLVAFRCPPPWRYCFLYPGRSAGFGCRKANRIAPPTANGHPASADPRF